MLVRGRDEACQGGRGLVWSRSAVVAILGLITAGWLHQFVCEWRLKRYPIPKTQAAEARLLLPLRTFDHGGGNTQHWDAAAAFNRAQIPGWLQCYDEVHQTPSPEEGAARAACFAELRFPVVDSADRSVALAECEYARFGRVRRRDEIGACLAKRGLDPAALPRWTTDTHGPRFTTPYRERFGLWAEAASQDPARDRRRAWLFGLALPVLLVGAGLSPALIERHRRRSRERRPA